MPEPKDIKIMVADDEPELLETIATIFRQFGFTVMTAPNGAEAWKTIERTPFDIVITDIRMPILDGVGLLKKIRERDAVKPCVLMISGFSDYPAETLFHLGANGYFHKPFTAESVKDAIRRAMLIPRERWAQKTYDVNTHKLSRTYQNFEGMIETGDIRFGNGGFFLVTVGSNPPANTTVQFQLRFQNAKFIEKIEGQGIVRWSRVAGSADARKGIGIEIQFLADSCRAALCGWMERQGFKSFIPRN